MLLDVYCHTSPSGKRYVGYSKRGMSARWEQHVSQALGGSPTAFHRAIRKYGAGSFKHELLEQCDTDAGAKRAEQRWIVSRCTRTTELGYNETAGGDGASGYVHDEVSRAKNSAARIGKPLRPESIAKRSAKQRGKPRQYSAESRAAISAAVARANARRAWTPAAREAQARKSLGRKHTPDEIEKMRRAWTPEMRAAAADRARARKNRSK
jgi:group I intron endonuclease